MGCLCFWPNSYKSMLHSFIAILAVFRIGFEVDALHMSTGISKKTGVALDSYTVIFVSKCMNRSWISFGGDE